MSTFDELLDSASPVHKTEGILPASFMKLVQEAAKRTVVRSAATLAARRDIPLAKQLQLRQNLVETPQEAAWLLRHPKGRQAIDVFHEMPEVYETRLLIDNLPPPAQGTTGGYIRSAKTSYVNPEKVGSLGWSPSRFFLHEYLGGHPLHSPLVRPSTSGRIFPGLHAIIERAHPAAEGYATGVEGLIPQFRPKRYTGAYDPASGTWGPWRGLFERARDIGTLQAERVGEGARPWSRQTITRWLDKLTLDELDHMGLLE